MRLALHPPRRSSRPAPMGLRARAWWHQSELDRQLSDSAEPGQSPELATRAHQLASANFRLELVAQLDSVLAKAEHPPHWRSVSIPVQASEVEAARAALLALRRAILDSPTLYARGAALASCLLNDHGGPIYQRHGEGTVAQMATAASAALTGLPPVV